MRIRSLDSIRGLAAAAVVFAHCLGTYLTVTGKPIDPLIWVRTLSPSGKMLWIMICLAGDPVGAGTGPVMIFFVLSGLVLALPYVTPNKALPSYRIFAVRRFSRIYLPFAFAVVCAVGLYTAIIWSGISNDPHTSVNVMSRLAASAAADASLTPGQPVPQQAVLHEPARVGLRQLRMTGVGDDNYLDHPVWSLIVEMRISFIFPLLCLFFLRAGAVVSCGAGLGVFAVSAVLEHFLWPDGTFIGTVLQTTRYILFFLMGIWMARLYVEKKIDFSHFSHAALVGLWSLALIGLLPSWVRFGSTPAEFVYSGGATLLIALCIYSNRANNFLALRPIVWLGRVSYSLYLIHVPLLYSCFHLLYGRAPIAVVYVVFVIVLIPMSELMYRFVEVPSISLGRYLTGKKHLYAPASN